MVHGDQPDNPSDRSAETTSGAGTEKRFHGWRLLAVIMGIVVLLAVVSFLVDWAVIGPLEGRAF